MDSPYIYPPQVPSKYGTPPEVPSGQVWLFNGAKSWSDPYYVINTKNSNPRSQYNFVGTPGENSSDWVAFNLPEGVVMTLMNNPTTPPPGEPFNFAGAGVCVDLFGNGKTQTVDLSKVGAVNCLSAYIWRKVDLSMGVFQLFDSAFKYDEKPNENTIGPRYTFFLCEWDKDIAHSLKDWAICDASDAIYFSGLNAQSVHLYDGGNGDGSKCGPYAGWYESTSTSLEAEKFINKAGSWSWELLTPVYTTIDSVTVDVPATGDSLASMTQQQQGINRGSSTIDETVTYNVNNSQTLSCTMSHSVTLGFKQKVSMSYTTKVTAGVTTEEIKTSIELAFSQEIKQTTSNTTSTTQTFSLTQQQVVHVPANSQWNSSWVIQLTKVPSTSFNTTAYYYYTAPVPNATYDEKMSNTLGMTVYCLKATTTGVVNGSIAVSSNTHVKTTPITSNEYA